MGYNNNNKDTITRIQISKRGFNLIRSSLRSSLKSRLSSRRSRRSSLCKHISHWNAIKQQRIPPVITSITPEVPSVISPGIQCSLGFWAGKSKNQCSRKGENKSRTHNLKKAKLYNRPQIPGVWPPYPSELRTFPCKVADPEHSNWTTVFLQGNEQLNFLQCSIPTNSLVAPVTLTCPIPTTATISAATKSWLVKKPGRR